MGLQQVLWLFGPEHRITEVGAMNIFVFLDKGNGGEYECGRTLMFDIKIWI